MRAVSARAWVLLATGLLAAVSVRETISRDDRHVGLSGTFWEALDGTGQPLEQDVTVEGVLLRPGERLRLRPDEGEGHAVRRFSVRARPIAPTSVLRLSLRDDGRKAWRVLVSPGAPTRVVVRREQPDRDTETIATATVERDADAAADPRAPFEVTLRSFESRLAIAVDGRQVAAWEDDAPPRGEISIAPDDAPLRLLGVSVSGLTTNQRGYRKEFDESDDFASLARVSLWRGRLATLGGGLLLALLAGAWLAALARTRPSAAALADATARLLAPAGALLAALAIAGDEWLSPPPAWLLPASVAAFVAGLPLAFARLAAGAPGVASAATHGGADASGAGSASEAGSANGDGSASGDTAQADTAAAPGRRPRHRLAWVALAAVVTLGGAAVVFAQTMAALVPNVWAERDAIEAVNAAPPEAVERAAPLHLDAGNAFVSEGPWRDLELTARVTLQPDAALLVRLRAEYPEFPMGRTFVVSADPRLASGFVREEIWTWEPLAPGVAAPPAGVPFTLHLAARARDVEASIAGVSVARHTAADHPAGAVVLLAARGEVTVEDLALQPLAGLSRPANVLWPASLDAGALAAAVVAWALLAPLALGLSRGRAAALGALGTVPLVATLTAAAQTGRLSDTAIAAASVGVAVAWLVAVVVRARGRGRARPAVLALAVLAGAPLLVAGAIHGEEVPSTASLNNLPWDLWSGDCAHDDLLWLTHPLIRRWNPYLAQHAFHGRTFAPSPPSGTRRVVCLGGSSTYGFRLPLSAHADWPTVMESLLAAEPGAGPVQVINAAWPGATSNRSLRLLRDALVPLQPDVVVACFAYNDAFSATLGDEEAYYARITAPGYERGWLDRLADRREVRAGQARLRRLMAAFAAGRKDGRSTSEAWEGLGLGARARAPTEVFADTLRRLSDLARERGWRLVLVKEPVRNPSETLWIPEFHGVIDQIGAEGGWPVVDPGPALEAAATEAGGPMFMDVVHPNIAGSRATAAAVAPTVAEQLSRP